ncbi:MAG: hypothetical protein JSV09_06705 [Thermoplasmata archaeon]|nr:MAG: hypothetical protein JSV09_06705 [Thermoplasmata archaeon]
MRDAKRLGKVMVITMVLSILAILSVGLNVVAQEDELEDAEWALFGIGLAIFAICMVIILIIAILIAVWLYKDAEKRGKSGALWVVILIVAALLFSIFGIIGVIVIWILVRPPIGMAGAPPPGYPPQQPGYPPQQPPYYPPQQPGYPPQQPPQQPGY